MNFSEKTVLITGAAQGIGRATALLLAEHSANLVITDVDRAALDRLEQQLRDSGVKVMSRLCDVREEAVVRQVVEDALLQFGAIHALINNAGIYRDDRMPFAESESGHWKLKIDVNILGTMHMTRAVIGHMMRNKYGRIVNLGSVAGVYGLRNMVDYSMTKGAIIAFTKALSKEVGPYGITVNTVSPGNITDTSRFSDMSFLERSGTPRECAQLIGFLAGDEAGYISGQNYQIDGSRRFM